MNTWSSAASSRHCSSTRFKNALGLCPVAFHNPWCRLANSARVGRSQLYQRLFASSSRRARRAGIFGRTCKLYAVLLFMGRLRSKDSKLCSRVTLDYSVTVTHRWNTLHAKAYLSAPVLQPDRDATPQPQCVPQVDNLHAISVPALHAFPHPPLKIFSAGPHLSLSLI